MAHVLAAICAISCAIVRVGHGAEAAPLVGDGPSTVPAAADVAAHLRSLGMERADVADMLVRRVSDLSAELSEARAVLDRWWTNAPLEHLGLQDDALRNAVAYDYSVALQHWKYSLRAIARDYFSKLAAVAPDRTEIVDRLRVRFLASRILSAEGLREVIPSSYVLVPAGAHAGSIEAVFDALTTVENAPGAEIERRLVATLSSELALLDESVIGFWFDQQWSERQRIRALVRSGEARDSDIAKYVERYAQPYQRLRAIHDAVYATLSDLQGLLPEQTYRVLRLRCLAPSMRGIVRESAELDRVPGTVPEAIWSKLVIIDQQYAGLCTLSLYRNCIRNLVLHGALRTPEYDSGLAVTQRQVQELSSMLEVEGGRR